MSLSQDGWTLFIWGLKAKNKRNEWHQLMQPVMMHALLHQKSSTHITLTTECDLYSTYYDYYAAVIFTLHSMEYFGNILLYSIIWTHTSYTHTHTPYNQWPQI